MDKTNIGVPTVRGMTGAFTDFAVGVGGGLIYAIAQGLFGSGLIGALAAPVLAGSVVKGARGTALATIAGFMLFNAVGGRQAAAPSDAGDM